MQYCTGDSIPRGRTAQRVRYLRQLPRLQCMVPKLRYHRQRAECFLVFGLVSQPVPSLTSTLWLHVVHYRPLLDRKVTALAAKVPAGKDELQHPELRVRGRTQGTGWRLRLDLRWTPRHGAIFQQRRSAEGANGFLPFVMYLFRACSHLRFGVAFTGHAPGEANCISL